MPNFALRYDMRQPDFSTASAADMYAAAVEQCAWAENNGFSAVHLSEHHGTTDNYCPSPLLLAAAIASRTESLMLMISALIAPLHEPIRLAEDLAVLDNLSKGRVIPVVSAGYRAEEFAAIGKSLADRKAYMDEILPFFQQAWQGEEFEYQGRKIRVTPRPHSQPRPTLLMGGSSRAAARRAARHADYFAPSGPEIFDMYREELGKLGKDDPGPMPRAAGSVFFVSDDKDSYWQKIAAHLLHETNNYADWAKAAGIVSPYIHCESLKDLQASGLYRVFTPEEMIDLCCEQPDQHLISHPMCGGIDPDTAWQSLKLFAERVLPVLRERGVV